MLNNPQRPSACLESVTINGGKSNYSHIKITKTIATHFMQHCRNCEHCQNEMRAALAKAEGEDEI